MKNLYITLGLFTALYVLGQGTKTQPLSEFTGLSTEGNFEVELVYSDEYKVVLQGDEDDLEKVSVIQKEKKVEVKNRKKNMYYNSSKIMLTVYARHFEQLTFGGSSQVKARQTLQEKDLSVSCDGSGKITLDLNVTSDLIAKINGSGDINLSGTAQSAELAINGSGNLSSSALDVKSANVKINGSGDAALGKVKEKIEVKINGSGDVTYKGNPTQTSTKINGSGQVKTQ